MGIFTLAKRPIQSKLSLISHGKVGIRSNPKQFPLSFHLKNSQIPLHHGRNTFSKRFLSGANTVVVPVEASRSVAYWLLGCGGMVAAMVAVGGATRLTRSGLSMTDWKPHGGLPPLTQKEWQLEFDRYKQFPEFSQRQQMTLGEFKRIFFWEYGHRMLGRTIGLCFAVPLGYFLLRKKIPRNMYGRMGALFSLGAAQGGIGWWMVKSGLEQQNHDRSEIRVSPYRLATHLGFAFTTYSLLLWTAFDILNTKSSIQLARDTMDKIVLSKAQSIRKVSVITSALLGVTALSGAFVAGIDAGMAYNTFPKMDGKWIPDEAFSMTPLYKNIFENTALVQFDHRVLALSTLTGVLTMYGLARSPKVWSQLPTSTKNALNLTLGLTGAQVTLGITTLLNCVPLPLALCHQSGSLAVLSSVLWTMHNLRFAKAIPSVLKSIPKV